MNLTARRAAENDLPTVSRLALELTRQHRAYDSRRFVGIEDHEARLFKELGVSVLQVAPQNERARRVLGGHELRPTLPEMMLDLSAERG